MPIEINRKLLIGAAVLVIILAFVSGMKYAGMRDDANIEETPGTETVTLKQPEPSAEPDKSGRSADSGTIKVYVAGAVQHPDVYGFDRGARVYEALMKAEPLPGADLTAIGMARKLQDGETLRINRTDEGTPETGAPPDNEKSRTLAPAENSTGLVNINQASLEELDRQLPGIGPALAGRIVDYRNNNGPFSDIEQLKKVSGIGNKKYEGIADLITVD